MNAVETALAIQDRRLSVTQAVSQALDRILKLNPKFQYFVQVWEKAALRDAEAKDHFLARHPRTKLPPFFGVPTAIKDLNFVRGHTTGFGSKASLPFPSPVDDLTVGRLRRAGFVFLGKTTTSELGVLPVTETRTHPPTRNPWNPEYTPGGSSGGAAVAVSTGTLQVAQSSDGGGSIRIPAGFTGQIGLKPSRGRLPHPFGAPDHQILYTMGMITHDLTDTAAMLDLMAGITFEKPHWLARPTRPFAELLNQDPGPLRIAFTEHSGDYRSEPAVAEQVRATAKRLEQLGHIVTEVPFPDAVHLEDALPLFQKLFSGIPFVRWAATEKITQWLRREGVRHKHSDIRKRHELQERQLLKWFEPFDLWLTPTVGRTAPKIGEFQAIPDARDSFLKAAEVGAFTAFANITGQPAMSIPAPGRFSGLPIGLQLTAAVGREDHLLQVARQLAPCCDTLDDQ